MFPAPQLPTQAAPEERSALLKVRWFGILQLVGIAAGWMGVLFIGGSPGSLTAASLGHNPAPSQVSAALGPVFASLASLVPILAAVQVAAVLMLILALRQLKAVDGRFSVPSVLTMVLLVGALLTVSGAVPLFSLLPSLIAQTTTSGTTVPTGLAGTAASLALYFFIMLIGGILALVGLIGGQVLGLWRLGSKYDEAILKAGAIFIVVPFLNIASPILIIVGTNRARAKTGGPA